MNPHPPLEQLLQISSQPNAVFPRGGAYSPDLNVWVVDGFASYAAQAGPERRSLLEACAQMALAAGAVHRQQLADAYNGRLWPASWIRDRDGAALVAFAGENPHATSPYACVDLQGRVIPYSIAYRSRLRMLNEGIRAALVSGDPSVEQQASYLQALLHAFSLDPDRVSDLEAMAAADIAWVQIPEETPLLLLAEFTESYSDPLKNLVLDRPEVVEWARSVVQKNGLGPWKFFFEFRVLEKADDVLSPAEIAAIRETDRRLYAPVTDGTPGAQVKTEFRRALIVAGHGANPPKSAKNYPNQSWVRDKYGYRNVIYANQVEAALEKEILPALRAAFRTYWAQSADLPATITRARALFIVAHEETHPWARFNEVSWMEELKSDVLGMWVLANSPTVKVDIADVLIGWVAAGLLLHRYHLYLLKQGDAQFKDYHIGDTIFCEHLLRSGFFALDEQGKVVDIHRSLALPALESFARRVLGIRAGVEPIGVLYDGLYQNSRAWEHFQGWVENQDYFEKVWAG